MVLPAYAGALNTRTQRQTALITGASSGIGRDLARLMAADFDLILVARSRDKLAELRKELESQHSSHVHVMPADLSRPEAADGLFAEITRRKLQVDVLINNAAFGLYGKFSTTGLLDELRMIQLNITTLTHLTKLALPGMLERKHGRIMNVASTAGFQPGPLMAVYYATKSYVISFSEAVASELKGTGVSMTCLCPGPTNTEFAAQAKVEKSRLFRLGAMNSVDVARAGMEGMLRGKPLVIPGVRNKLLAQSVRFTPRKMVTAISRKILESAE